MSDWARNDFDKKLSIHAKGQVMREEDAGCLTDNEVAGFVEGNVQPDELYDYYTGAVISVTDSNNKVTNTSYTSPLLGAVDPFVRPGAVTDPQNRTIASRYYDITQQVEVWSDLNAANDALLRSRGTHDQLGRAIKKESSEDGGSYTLIADTGYEQMGRIVYTSNPHRSSGSSTDGWIRTTKDVIGRVVEVATFDGATKPSATATNWNGRVQTSYNAEQTTVTDQAGKVRRSLLDGSGRLIRVDEPDSNNNLGSVTSPVQPTSYSYDALGDLTLVQQGGQQRIFAYDSLLRLTSAKNPEQVNTSGQMVATTYAYYLDKYVDMETALEAFSRDERRTASRGVSWMRVQNEQ